VGPRRPARYLGKKVDLWGKSEEKKIRRKKTTKPFEKKAGGGGLFSSSLLEKIPTGKKRRGG